MQIGIDLGGTKIEGIALDADAVDRVPDGACRPRASYDGTLDAIARLVAELEAETRAERHRRRRHPRCRHAAPPGWSRTPTPSGSSASPLRADLEARLARPVRLANDANCFALSEAIDGAGRGYDTVFGVILGTGVGGGIVIRRRIHDGPNHIAGEWGHNPLPWMTDEERAAARRATAGSPAASRPFSPVPGSSAITRAHRHRTFEP